MEEKKKPTLSAVWNQVDKPPVLPKCSNSAVPKKRYGFQNPPKMTKQNVEEHFANQESDKPPVLPKCSKSDIPKKKYGFQNPPKNTKQNVEEHFANQDSYEASIKNNIASKRHDFTASSKTAFLRSSCPNNEDNLRNDSRHQVSQKSLRPRHSRSPKRVKSKDEHRTDIVTIKKGHYSSKESIQATCSRFSDCTIYRDDSLAENAQKGVSYKTYASSKPLTRNYPNSSSSHKRSENNVNSRANHKSNSPATKSNNSNYESEHDHKFFPNYNKNIKPISFLSLRELVTKEPNEILITICPKNCAFMQLIAQKSIRTDLMALVLITLGKACSACHKQTLCSFLNTLRGKEEFLVISVQSFLVSLRQESLKDYHLESLFYLAVFLQKFQQTLPSSSSDLISMLLPLLRLKCDTFLKDQKSYRDVMSKLTEIEEQNEYFISQHPLSEIKKVSRIEQQQFIEPPDNFRSLPVLPTIDDIHSDAFLRPNIVEGKYVDVEHYLDVQYRLLREDYVKPLRDGIGEYLRLKEVGKSVKSYRDVRVYENVHIVKQEFVNGNLLHIAQFADERFSRIRWEYSKRFLTGSLLCLSSDDFKTMLFASVARRLPEQLLKGLLLIQFEEITDEVLNISPLRSFVIVETTAYFEAYRYNLKALLECNEQVLPLKKYIVDVETTVQPPHYLDHSTRYDMRPLLIPMNSTLIKRTETLNSDTDFQYQFPSHISGIKNSVSVLNDNSWPSASELNLDDSQYLALKAAVTEEFAIIQGPPGTGKTYIGLRIVQLLLYNIDKWHMKSTNSLPILVVCYTNHALDQFLEGMMCFTDKIVRIGGRGLNETVSRYQLNNLKRAAINKKEIPHFISTGMWLQNQELKSSKLDIDTVNLLVQKSLKNVLGESVLEKYIPKYQYNSLKSAVNSPEFQTFNLDDDNLIIHDWLGVRSRLDWDSFKISNEVQDEAKPEIADPEPAFMVVDDVDQESVEEADIEFIEAQRDIDNEVFAGVSFDIEDVEKEVSHADNSGWQYQGGRKQKFKFIKNWLNKSEPLEEAEALKIMNVWNLELSVRWNLYKFWLKRMIDEKQNECMELQRKLKTQYQQLCELRTEEDIFILQKAHVVGMTTTGAAKYRHIVQRLNPQILIVEEAAEILESHIVTSLASSTQHIILIGDHQQLRPSPTVHLLAVKYGLNISLFERMIKNKMYCYKLSMQHRMRPDITDLIVPHIYKELKNHANVYEYENIKGVNKNLYFISHNYCELQEIDSKSRSNEHEAKFLISLCKYFIQQGYDSSKITILTTYSGQLFSMKNMVKKNKIVQNVRITVVDNYQGEENDIILISFVRSNEDGDIGFLKIANRVCVALSRAKKGLFCIGNFELLAEKSDLWKSITKTLNQKKAIGPSLQLLCQNHPKVCSVVASEKDFESVPEGGCTKICEYRLSCGHACSLMCHPYDRSHIKVRCYKTCEKTCEKGHKCPKKCYQDCGPCKHPVSVKVLSCGHRIDVPCYSAHLEITCHAECSKILICGHKCPNKCNEACVEICREMITTKSAICGHEVTVPCYLKNSIRELSRRCLSSCNVILDCGHSCKGTCNRCHQGRLHISCNQPCKRILVCGHECKASCAKSCPPCKLPCENKCIHSKCPKECGEPCDMCKEKCQWQCKHKQCSQLCGEMCNRDPCNKPCLQPLRCGHPCIGFCGEPCPAECKVCDSEVVKEIFFGTEDEDDAHFVQLEDCNHILEISGLNEWMKVEGKDNHQIQMKACPKCKTAIRTNLRFGNIVKGSLKKIENVKQKTFGNINNNRLLQNKLLKYIENNAMLLLDLKSDSASLYDSWKKYFTAKKCRSIQEITTMENIVNISLELAKARNTEISYSNQVSQVRENLDNVKNFVESSECWMLEFMRDEIFTASEQQLKQLSFEVHRLRFGYKLLNLAHKSVIREPDLDFKNCISILTNYCAFGDENIKMFCGFFKALAEKCGSAVINISDMEKQSILKAMGLSAGHWYQCPNGHVYCIADCGGAMVTSRCNECDAEIGGTNHRLLSSNRLASDMDGARYPAWSDAMNLANYRF